MKKFLAILLTMVLTAGVAISGTVAYLQDDDSDVNVMTMGNVKIEQHEYERKVNDDGAYATIDTVRGTSYELVDFTQAKPLLPTTCENPSSLYWDETNVYFAQLADGEVKEGDMHYYGLMNVFPVELTNVQDKFVFVENTGKTDAYVRTIIALEAGSCTFAEWDSLIKTSTNGFWTYTWLENTVNINGNNYVIVVCDYTGSGVSGTNGRHPDGIVHPGDYTYNNLAQVYMTSKATNEDVEALDGNKNGTYDILVLSQAVQAAGFEDAQTALDTAFPYGENNVNLASWFGEAIEESKNTVEIPEDAVAVSEFEDFKEALKKGGNYEITAPFTVEGILSVAADTAFYNNNPENVITFAQNARLKTAENADFALYGIKIDGGGSFNMADGEFTTDATAYNDDAILMAFAGSTLTLGKGTVVENVVSDCPAVAWAKGTVDNRATIIFDGATVRNCAGGSGSIINVDAYGDVYIEEGTVIENNVSHSGNHGIMRIYYGSTLTINGGEICNNYFSGNGMIGLWSHKDYPNTKMYMNGGKISNNSFTKVTSGFYCIVYVHQYSKFEMNDGEISNNKITEGAINAINSEVENAITFNGGTVTNNANARNEGKDALAAVCLPNAVAVPGGTSKVLYISDEANVTGTVYSHANLEYQVDKKYVELSEFLGD